MQKLTMYRLIADEGKLVTNGTLTGSVIDVAPGIDPDTFLEIDDPDYTEEPEEPEEPEDNR